MQDRVETLRYHLDDLFMDTDHLWADYVQDHMLVVSNFAAMLAEKRGLDPQIATMIALLHDIHTAFTGDTENHAMHGSHEARKILGKLAIVDDDEMETICHAIAKHSKKRKIHDEYSELIKDADVLSHYYYNTSYPIIEKDSARLEALKVELGIAG